jgi:hypothetical protein
MARTYLPASALRYTDGAPVHRGDTIVQPIEGDVIAGRVERHRGGKSTLLLLVRPNGDERAREVLAEAAGIRLATPDEA